MFDTEFARYRSVDNNKIVLVRVTKPYSLPEDVASAVALVDDLIRLPSVNNVLVDTTAQAGVDAAPFQCGTSCNGYTTPAVLEQAYSYSLLKTANKNSSVAVAEFQGQYYDDADLASFNKACGVDVRTKYFFCFLRYF